MDPYRQLFRDYVADLTAAKDYAETWWAALLEAETQHLGDLASAEETLNQRWPLGPTSHPRVIAVYRKYYRACSAISNALDALAAERDEQEDEAEEDDDTFTTVSTGTFLIDYLCDESDALGEFLLHMVFIPIEAADEQVLPADLEQPGTVEKAIRAVADASGGQRP